MFYKKAKMCINSARADKGFSLMKILIAKIKAKMYINSARADKGFSLMEILIALVLVVGVFATVFTNVMQNRDKGQVSQAKIIISRLVDALNTFYMDCSYYPSTAEGLEALVTAPQKCESWGPEPYLKNGKIPKDPWKNDFIYEYDDSSGSFEIISLGKGGKDGGEKPPHPTADISSKDL